MFLILAVEAVLQQGVAAPVAGIQAGTALHQQLHHAVAAVELDGRLQRAAGKLIRAHVEELRRGIQQAVHLGLVIGTDGSGERLVFRAVLQRTAERMEHE